VGRVHMVDAGQVSTSATARARPGPAGDGSTQARRSSIRHVIEKSAFSDVAPEGSRSLGRLLGAWRPLRRAVIDAPGYNAGMTTYTRLTSETVALPTAFEMRASSPTDLPGGLTAEDAARITTAINAAYAASTRSVYGHQWRAWERWCTARGFTPLPGPAWQSSQTAELLGRQCALLRARNGMDEVASRPRTLSAGL
jgi:hypothetical protein